MKEIMRIAGFVVMIGVIFTLIGCASTSGAKEEQSPEPTAIPEATLATAEPTSEATPISSNAPPTPQTTIVTPEASPVVTVEGVGERVWQEGLLEYEGETLPAVYFLGEYMWCSKIDCLTHSIEAVIYEDAFALEEAGAPIGRSPFERFEGVKVYFWASFGLEENLCTGEPLETEVMVPYTDSWGQLRAIYMIEKKIIHVQKFVKDSWGTHIQSKDMRGEEKIWALNVSDSLTAQVREKYGC